MAAAPQHDPTVSAKEVVIAYEEAKREGLDAEARRYWRELLVEAAQAAGPEDSWAAEAFLYAGWLSSALATALADGGDPSAAMEELDAQERWLRACVEHPAVEPTCKLMALLDLTKIDGYARGNVYQGFADLNEIRDTILKLEPQSLRESWLPQAYRVPLEKAYMLQAFMGTRKERPVLPLEDLGKAPSDYYLEFMNLPPEVRQMLRARGFDVDEVELLGGLADCYALEGKGKLAAEYYRKVEEHPDNTAPPSLLRRLAARALYPEGGLKYVELLEQAERELAPDEQSRDLSYDITMQYHLIGQHQRFIERARPLLESDDPADREFLEQSNRRMSLLSALGRSYAQPSVGDLERAIECYEQLLAEYPDRCQRNIVYLKLADWYARRKPPDYERALYYCELLLSEFPEEVNAPTVARKAAWLRERLDAQATPRRRGSNHESHGEQIGP